MKLFADSFFFFAYLSPKDRMHEQRLKSDLRLCNAILQVAHF